MVPRSWIIDCLNMYKISNEVIKFIEKAIETWRVKLTAGGKGLAEVKIQRGIFQGDALLPLLFVIAMVWLNHLLRKCTGGYKLSKLQEKINHMDDIKLCKKTKKKWNPNSSCENIQSRTELGYGIEKFATLIMKSGKRYMTEWMELSNQEKIRTLGEADTIKQVEMKERIKKRISLEKENTTRNQTIWQEPHKRDK